MLTKEKYEAIICMLRGGATDETIMKSQGVNDGTLKRVKESNGSFERYRELHGELLKSRNVSRAKPNLPPVSMTVQATHYMECELRVHTELLKGISAKLAFIVEELTGKEGNNNE